MPAPPQVNVLWRFAPTGTGDFDGTYIGEWGPAYYNEYYDQWYGAGGGSVTDNIQINIWASYGDYIEWAYAVKYATNAGYIHRFKCTFSVSEFPNYESDDDRFGVWGIGRLNYGSYYYIEPELFVHRSGCLSFGYDYPTSERALSPGASYELEIYMDANPEREFQLWQLYLDGELWLSQETEYPWWDLGHAMKMNFGFEFGFGTRAPDEGLVSVNLSLLNPVWTMEDSQLALGRWTMLALL